MKNRLDELRQQLDHLDTEIIRLLDERFILTDQVADYKNTLKLPLTDKSREQNVIGQLKARAKHPALREHLDTIYQPIIEANKKYRVLNQYKEFPFSSIGILGLGIIGGSIAKAIKSKNKSISLFTVRREGSTHTQAIEDQYIDKEYESITEMLGHVDLIVLAGPIESLVPYAQAIASYKNQLSKSLIVMDVGSVKSKIASEFEHYTTDTVEFIPTHPMAGSDKIGFGSSVATLFVNHPWVITPHKKTTQETLKKIQALVSYIGADSVVIEPELHDKWVATVSHLVFVLSTYIFSFASNAHTDALQVAGSGFTSITRLASGSPVMHDEITQNNYSFLTQMLSQFIDYLQSHPLTKEGSRVFYEKNKIKRDLFINDRNR